MSNPFKTSKTNKKKIENEFSIALLSTYLISLSLPFVNNLVSLN